MNIFSIIMKGFNGHIFGYFTSKLVTSKENADYVMDDMAFLCVVR